MDHTILLATNTFIHKWKELVVLLTSLTNDY